MPSTAGVWNTAEKAVLEEHSNAWMGLAFFQVIIYILLACVDDPWWLLGLLEPVLIFLLALLLSEGSSAAAAILLVYGAARVVSGVIMLLGLMAEGNGFEAAHGFHIFKEFVWLFFVHHAWQSWKFIRRHRRT